MGVLDIVKACGSNMGGVPGVVYIAEMHDVLLIPADTDKVVASAITFKTGKCFSAWQVLVDKTKLDVANAGEIGGKSKDCTLSLVVKRQESTTDKSIDTFLNCEAVILVKDANSNNYRIIGDLVRGAVMDTDAATTGDAFTALNHYAVTFKYARIDSPLWYSGTIALTPAV